jgi:glutathione S-transferase
VCIIDVRDAPDPLSIAQESALMALVVHHLENSRSHRVLWLLEELGVDYDIQRYERDSKTKRAPESLREVHPLGKSPVITDEDRTVAESAVILEYILDEYGDGEYRPATGTDAHQRYRYWMHYTEGSAMVPLLIKLLFDEMINQAPWPAVPLVWPVSKVVNGQFIDPEINRHMTFWEDSLADQTYFVGDQFTAADIQMSFPLAGGLRQTDTPDEYPRCRALLERLESRDGFNQALAASGDDSPLP